HRAGAPSVGRARARGGRQRCCCRRHPAHWRRSLLSLRDADHLGRRLVRTLRGRPAGRGRPSQADGPVMRPHPNDLTVAAVTLSWDLVADLAPDRSRRRRARAAVAVAGTAALLWVERESLAEAREGWRSLRELRERISTATSEEELDAILAA